MVKVQRLIQGCRKLTKINKRARKDYPRFYFDTSFKYLHLLPKIKIQSLCTKAF